MALEVYNNVLYAGGSFVTSGGATNIAQWNGTSWDAVGPGANGEVYALKVYNSTLVAGGQFDNIGSRIRITSYNVCYTKLLRFFSLLKISL